MNILLHVCVCVCEVYVQVTEVAYVVENCIYSKQIERWSYLLIYTMLYSERTLVDQIYKRY